VQAKLRNGHALSELEAESVARVPRLGSDLLKRIPRLGPVADIIRHLSKSTDEEYPTTQRPDDPTTHPFGARLIRLLSDLVEIESDGTSRREALDILRSRTGRYDSELLRAVVSYFEGASEADQS